MNYKNINRKLLCKYKRYLINKRSGLECKAIGSYWTKYKWTDEDQNNWERTNQKIITLTNRYCIY